MKSYARDSRAGKQWNKSARRTEQQRDITHLRTGFRVIHTPLPAAAAAAVHATRVNSRQ